MTHNSYLQLTLYIDKTSVKTKVKIRSSSLPVLLCSSEREKLLKSASVFLILVFPFTMLFRLTSNNWTQDWYIPTSHECSVLLVQGRKSVFNIEGIIWNLGRFSGVYKHWRVWSIISVEKIVNHFGDKIIYTLNFGYFMLKMVDSFEFCMFSSGELRWRTLMKNIGGDDPKLLGDIYPHPPRICAHVLVTQYTHGPTIQN